MEKFVDEDNDLSKRYNEEDDLKNESDQEDRRGGTNDMRNELMEIMNEELSEPEIMHFCKDYQVAIDLVKKCIKIMNDKSWTVLKKHLQDEVNCNVENLNDNNEERRKFFVKHFYLGVAHFKLGEYEEALSCFFEANKIYQYFQLNYNIALCYIKLDNLENAVFYLEAVKSRRSNYFFAHYNLIRIYLKKNNINDAYLIYRDFSDIIKKDKEAQKHDIGGGSRLSTATFNALKLFYKLGAECCFAKSLYQECVHTILEALKFNPEDPELWCLYAKVFIMKKAFDYAIPLLEKALQINPHYNEAKELLEYLKTEIV